MAGAKDFGAAATSVETGAGATSVGATELVLVLLLDDTDCAEPSSVAEVDVDVVELAEPLLTVEVLVLVLLLLLLTLVEGTGVVVEVVVW